MQVLSKTADSYISIPLVPTTRWYDPWKGSIFMLSVCNISQFVLHFLTLQISNDVVISSKFPNTPAKGI